MSLCCPPLYLGFEIELESMKWVSQHTNANIVETDFFETCSTSYANRLLEFCKAFEVQTENTHSQSGCGYDQIRLYEPTLSCRSLQTVAASSICKTPTLRG